MERTNIDDLKKELKQVKADRKRCVEEFKKLLHDYMQIERERNILLDWIPKTCYYCAKSVNGCAVLTQEAGKPCPEWQIKDIRVSNHEKTEF